MELRSAARDRFNLVRIAVALLLGFAFIAQTSSAALAVGGVTGTINGTVTDSATGKGLAGVTVTATSPISSQQTTTDDKGFFSLLGLSVDGIAGPQTWNHLVNGYLAAPDPQTAANGFGRTVAYPNAPLAVPVPGVAHPRDALTQGGQRSPRAAGFR